MSNMLGVTLRDARGPLNTLMERLTGRDGAMWLRRLNQFNRGKNPFDTPRIFEVTSNGLPGRAWITRLEKSLYKIGDHAKKLLQSVSFATTNGVTYRLTIIKGDEFKNNERLITNIRAEADQRGYLTPPVEVAPLLRELISDEELRRMGRLSIVVMHEPINLDGLWHLLGVNRSGGDQWLLAYDCSRDYNEYKWGSDLGFVFLVPQE